MKRLIVIIIIFALFIAFIVFNLENKSDVSFGLKTFEQIPVFLTVFCSFVLGMLFALPFTISFDIKRWGFKGKNKTPDSGASDTLKKENSPYGID